MSSIVILGKYISLSESLFAIRSKSKVAIMKLASFALLLSATSTLARPLLFVITYRDRFGAQARISRESGVADDQVQNVLNNMGRWSGGRYQAFLLQGHTVEVTNVNDYPSYAATDGVFHDMYMHIANNIPRQMPDPPDV